MDGLKTARRVVFSALACLAMLGAGGCAELDALRQRVEVQDKEIERLRKDNEEFKNAYYRINAEKSSQTGTLDEQVKILMNQVEKEKSLKSEREKKLEDDLRKKSLEVDAEKAKTAALQQQFAEEKTRMVSAVEKSDQDWKAAKQHADELEAAQAKTQETLKAMDQKLAENATAVKSATDAKSASEAKLKAAEDERNKLKTELDQIKVQMESGKKQAEQTTQQLEQMKASQAGVPAAIESAQQEAKTLKEQLAAEKARSAELEKKAAEAAQQAGRKSGGGADAELEKAAGELRERLAKLPEGKGVELRTDAKGLRIIVSSDTAFNKSSVILAEAIKPVLMEIAETIRGLPGRRVRVEGHTDNQPMIDMPFADNWGLGSARADRVRQFLAGEGKIEQTRLELVTRSYFEPLGDNNTNEGRAKNRRVEVVVGPAGSL